MTAKESKARGRNQAWLVGTCCGIFYWFRKPEPSKYFHISNYPWSWRRSSVRIFNTFFNSPGHNQNWIYRSFSLSRSKKINRKPFSGWSQEIVILLKINKPDTSPSFWGLCVLPNCWYSSKCSAEIYRAQYGNAMLVHITCAPTWRPENSVNIWNLRWLSRRLTICT